MECPRCHLKTHVLDVPLLGVETAWVERCARTASCGIWYDERALAALHPRFAEASVLNALMSAPLATIAPAQEIACPRCGGIKLTARLFAGITLDVCARCRGVWVDSAEHVALLNALRLHAPGVGLAAGAYRSAYTGTSMQRNTQWSRCVACQVEVPFADAMFTERGLMCVPCGLAHQRRDET